MPVSASKRTGNIEIQLIVYRDCDDIELFWRSKVGEQIDAIIPDCLGYSIERQRKAQDGAWGNSEVLRNRVGFTDQPPAVAHDVGAPSQYSNIWPFQRYDWTDHEVNNAETVRYRVVAVRLPSDGVPGTTPLEPIADSDWTPEIAMSANCGGGVSAYFNRGFVMSQFVARLMRQNNWGTGDIKEKVQDLQEPLRRFLSGELRAALLNLLDEVIEDPGLEFYAALYELSDEELLGRLLLLRGRAHVVLANGSDKKGDENKAARDALRAQNVDVFDRLLGSKGAGHNKFAVVVRTQDGKALKVWTGSTNWTPSGLCTQVNNGIVIESDEIAQIYLDQWNRLREADSDFSKDLVNENATSPRIGGDGNIDVWFTRVRNHSTKDTAPGKDLQAVVNLVSDSSVKVILYVMFEPGSEVLGSILERASNIYVRGVVSTVLSTTEEKFSLMGLSPSSKDYKTALVEPEGIEKDFSAWFQEVTRHLFLDPPEKPGIGHAITHSKVIVIDPLSPQCQVITGSHNFSQTASEKNDDNFVVIRGNKDLAEAYAVACLATYEHYRWRAYVKDKVDAGQPVWSHLSDKPEWQEKYLTDERKKHLAVWCS